MTLSSLPMALYKSGVGHRFGIEGGEVAMGTNSGQSTNTYFSIDEL